MLVNFGATASSGIVFWRFSLLENYLLSWWWRQVVMVVVML